MENEAFEDIIYHLLNRGVSRERLQGEILLNLQQKFSYLFDVRKGW